MGAYLTRDAYNKIASAVEKLNERIAGRLRQSRSTPSLKSLQSADAIARAVCNEYPTFVTYIGDLDALLHSDAIENRYPGLLTAHYPFHCIYDDVILPVDPRQFYLRWRSSTLLVDGIYLSTDKIGHFVHNGFNYWVGYRDARRRGRSHEEATRSAIELGAGEHMLFSERRMLGTLTSGVISNADLAANYLGFLFYLNLTQQVELRGTPQEPMLTIQGNLWRINPHVRPGSDFFVRFISEHLDEALNPNLYDALTARGMRKAIARHSRDLRLWYVDANGEPREKRYFDEMRRTLRTYYGQDYGHTGMVDGLVSLVDVCFSSNPASPAERLHEAVRAGRVAEVESLLASGTGADSTLERSRELPLCIGATPLHVAVANGRREIVPLLLRQGADVNARTIRSVTPLHKAVEYPELIDLFVDAGADVNAKDSFARTPLHWAVRANQPRSVQRLLTLGSSLQAVDCDRETPLHHAARGRHLGIASILLAAGAEIDARGNYGMTPLHVAADCGHEDVCQLLLEQGANRSLVDEFGRTANDHAAVMGDAQLVRMLSAPPVGGQR
jgi:hypothetical protein